MGHCYFFHKARAPGPPQYQYRDGTVRKLDSRAVTNFSNNDAFVQIRLAPGIQRRLDSSLAYASSPSPPQRPAAQHTKNHLLHSALCHEPISACDSPVSDQTLRRIREPWGASHPVNLPMMPNHQCTPSAHISAALQPLFVPVPVPVPRVRLRAETFVSVRTSHVRRDPVFYERC
jgi:hypothetical protein